ncbi:MAG TPA: flippase-like domain-containing protein [Thermoleophilaceae bacterium]|nr:flippase-like domain-containing protein [Thermoleophilaceae bacterium]
MADGPPERAMTSNATTIRGTPLGAATDVELPDEYRPRRLLRRALWAVALLTVLVLVVVLAPGLGEVRDHLSGASPGWVLLAVALEAASGMSYVLMFRPIFCNNMPWRTSFEISWSELAMGSIVPASGAGGLALGAWVLHQGGMPGERIATRSVAFFLIKSSVNFVAVALIGTVLALGLVGPDLSLWLTALPAALAALLIGAVAVLPKLGPGQPAPKDAGKLRRAVSAARKALVDGIREAGYLLRSRDWKILLGSFGYWAFDNAVLIAAFNAFGYSPDVWIVLMGYLIGQLGGLLPLPGGLGGIDGGLLGTLVVYGTPAATTAAAVLTYRVILFWLPLIVGGLAFASLRRGLNRPERPELCTVPAAT